MAPKRATDERDRGGESLDGEHRVQIDLLRLLGEAVAAGRGVDEVDEILDRLIAFAKMHFASEQLLMRLYGFDGFAAHELEHDNAVEQMEALRAGFRAGDIVLAGETLERLRRSTLAHIQRADRAFGRFLDGIGASGG